MAVRVATGFEHGTTAGWLTGNAGNKFADLSNGTPTLTTSNPRTGTYALQCNPSAASENLGWSTATLTTSQDRIAAGFAVRFPSTVPTIEILAQDQVTAGLAAIVFTDSSDRICIGFEGGNTTTGPVASPDTWYYVELYHNASANPHTLDWSVDGTAQTQVTQAQAATTFTEFRLGTTNTETFDALFDDVIVDTSTSNITFPLGKHKVQLLSVDPAGTVTLSGTTGNFNTFTANGTLAAWNATTARNNIDEVPPTIGASADGWVQITTATGDYVEMPMTSYTLAGGETISGVRMLAPGWAVSGTAATFGFRSWNGTTETILQAGTVDPNFDNSTTVPAWVCKMLTLTEYDTQSELDALAFRAGFSSDAAPDIGIHAIYAEVAVKEATDFGATATPAVIAAITAVPNASRNITAGPAVTAGVAALPNSNRNVGAGPAVIPITTALPNAARNITAGPAVVPAVAALPQALAGQNVTLTPAVIAAVAALAQPNVHIQAGPAVLAAVAALTRADVNVAASPAAVALVAALPQATPDIGGGNATATPAVLAAVAALTRAAVNVTVPPAVIALFADVGMGVGGDTTVGATVVPAVAALPQATPITGGGATPTPAVIAAVAALPNAARNVTAGPAAISTSVSIPGPAVGVGASPAVLAALTALPGASVNVAASPAALVGVAAFPAPTVIAGGSATVTPAVVAALAALTQPNVNVRAGPAVIPLIAALGAAQAGQSTTASPAVVAALAALTQPNVNVGAGPAVIVLLAVVPLVTDAGGEPVPGYGVAYVGLTGYGVYVALTGGGAIVGLPAGKGHAA